MGLDQQLAAFKTEFNCLAPAGGPPCTRPRSCAARQVVPRARRDPAIYRPRV
jgi:hypothetical protein